MSAVLVLQERSRQGKRLLRIERGFRRIKERVGGLDFLIYMIGLCGGEGVLSMDTMDCKLTVGAISILSIGLAGGPFKSPMENLKDPADF